MRVLITGGTGFIGSRLALRHLEFGDSVRVLGQENTRGEVENRRLVEAEGAEIVLAPVTDRDAVMDAVRGTDLVYHLAAAQHEKNVPNQYFWDVNVEGTRNLLESSLSAGVGRVVHGSTIGVYGSAMSGTLDETSRLSPDNIYGVTKLEGERLALSYSDRLPVVAIRISETYGPGDRRLLKLFRAVKKRTFVMIGKGSNLHHPIYIDDLNEGLGLAAVADGVSGKAFVLPGADVVTTREMADAIASALGTSVRGVRAPLQLIALVASVAARVGGFLRVEPPIHPRTLDFFRKSFVFSQNGAAGALGFTPRFDFRSGVERTAKWYSDMGYLS